MLIPPGTERSSERRLIGRADFLGIATRPLAIDHSRD
jgi:hypothetical protein